jgi:hypothetical protein
MTSAHRRSLDQMLIALIGVLFAATAVQAAFFPRSFYDDFPMGRSWISIEGPAYNEHLVRDVGTLYLALVILSLWAWWSRALVRPVAVAWIVQGSLHVVHHLRHLHRFDGIDKFGIVFTLASAPVLATIALVLSFRTENPSPDAR